MLLKGNKLKNLASGVNCSARRKYKNLQYHPWRTAEERRDRHTPLTPHRSFPPQESWFHPSIRGSRVLFSVSRVGIATPPSPLCNLGKLNIPNLQGPDIIDFPVFLRLRIVLAVWLWVIGPKKAREGVDGTLELYCVRQSNPPHVYLSLAAE